MSSRPIRFALVCALVLSVVASWVAAEAVLSGAEGAKQQAKEKKPPRNFDVVADKMRVVWGEQSKVLLTGKVQFTHEDSKMNSEKVEWDRKEELAVFPEKVSITTEGTQASADRGQVFFKTKILTLEGSVNMLYTPKPKEENTKQQESARTAMQKETVLTCDKLEYDYKNKVVTATGGVDINQAQRNITADRLVFDQEAEIIRLYGNIRVVDDKGQEFTAPKEATVSIKEGDEWIEAPNPSAKFQIEVDD